MKIRALILLAIIIIPLMGSISYAQSIPSLSVTVTNTTVTITNNYYNITLNLLKGGSISSWLINTQNGKVQLVSNSNQVPSLILSINSTLPGELYNKRWEAYLIEKSSNFAEIMLTPMNLTNNISIKVYITASSYYPYLTYKLSLISNENETFIKDLYLGLGVNLPKTNWTFVSQYISNSILSYTINSNSSTIINNISKVTLIGSENSLNNEIVGLNLVTPTFSSLQFFKGFLNGTSQETGVSYLIVDIQNITLNKPNQYSLAFNLYGIPFNPELISLTNSLDIVSQIDPNIYQNITNLINYQSNINSYISKITSLNNTINNLTTRLGELQGLVSYWQVRYNETSYQLGQYSTRLHKNGEVSIGLFILGIVIGVLGGGFLLKPKPIETTVTKGGKKQGKKGK
ncbi:MAG: hypothetical protein ACP5I6_02265 [Caldisphaera sp.]|jgi:hypothetical protein|nr:hypothetical protein [Caldisphaera sp.]PMP60599.1 MAG: hypothetical protein C0201_02220 [Caldisphaera sp.]PMP89793.1 MAG: hypothetical protein C0171_06410 [Caldisphaera sp.]